MVIYKGICSALINDDDDDDDDDDYDDDDDDDDDYDDDDNETGKKLITIKLYNSVKTIVTQKLRTFM